MLNLRPRARFTAGEREDLRSVPQLEVEVEVTLARRA